MLKHLGIMWARGLPYAYKLLFKKQSKMKAKQQAAQIKHIQAINQYFPAATEQYLLKRNVRLNICKFLDGK